MRSQILKYIRQIALASGKWNTVLTPSKAQRKSLKSFVFSDYPIMIISRGTTLPYDGPIVAGYRGQKFTLNIATILYHEYKDLEDPSDVDLQNMLDLVDDNDQLQGMPITNGAIIQEWAWAGDNMYALENVIADESKPAGGNEIQNTVSFMTPRNQ